MDTYVDGLNILRDYIFATEVRLFCPQSTPLILIPYIDINNLSAPEPKRPPQPSTPPPAETKRSKEPKAPEPEKPQPNPPIIRQLTADSILPTYISRRAYNGDPSAPVEQIPVQAPKKAGGSRSDRRSQPDAGTVRKHSKTQAAPPLPTPPRENVEAMLKDFYEKAKDAAQKLQEAEHELRKTRYNPKFTGEAADGGKKTPINSHKGHDKHRPVTPIEPQLPPKKSGHEKAIDDETSHLLTRLQSILNYALMIMTESKKMVKSADAKILLAVDKIHKKETASAETLLEYIHRQIEMEEPIREALVYDGNQFGLSLNQFFKTDMDTNDVSLPQLTRTTPYEDFMKICPDKENISYEDLQKGIIYGVERSYGKEYVDRRWYQLVSDEIIASANQIIKPKLDTFPDGVNIYDVQLDWNDPVKAMGNPP